jgi:DNA-binding IclR family transcriptional regulator
VLQLDPDRLVGVADWVGVDVPLHASAAGKLALAGLAPEELDAWLATNPPAAFTASTITVAGALAAELERVRRRGWAELVDELEQGHSALACPLRAGDGSLAGAVGISGPTFRLGRARRRRLLADLQAAAAELEAILPSRSLS